MNLFCRKRPTDDSAPEFDSAMTNIFYILMNVSKEFLHKSASSSGVVDENEIEFAECICESMVSLGSSNLQCIAGDSTMISLYLQQVVKVPTNTIWGKCHYSVPGKVQLFLFSYLFPADARLLSAF